MENGIFCPMPVSIIPKHTSLGNGQSPECRYFGTYYSSTAEPLHKEYAGLADCPVEEHESKGLNSEMLSPVNEPIEVIHKVFSELYEMYGSSPKVPERSVESRATEVEETEYRPSGYRGKRAMTNTPDNTIEKRQCLRLNLTPDPFLLAEGEKTGLLGAKLNQLQI